MGTDVDGKMIPGQIIMIHEVELANMMLLNAATSGGIEIKTSHRVAKVTSHTSVAVSADVEEIQQSCKKKKSKADEIQMINSWWSKTTKIIVKAQNIYIILSIKVNSAVNFHRCNCFVVNHRIFGSHISQCQQLQQLYHNVLNP